ncbi:MAG: hypothetical protein KA313_09625 [Pseudarcicella sp.]|nr:hypothetical protein [Pseudarcicella sp.]MBP6411347.1 hypothetical protein [Pseudarcicella sp.]
MSDLYLPEDPVVLQEGNLRLGTTGFRNALQEEALRITGNAETPSPNQPNKRVARYRPRGSMTILDNNLNIIRPLVGVKVCASWWWYNATGITDGNGNYRCDDTFSNGHKVTYSLDWERYEFQIRSGWYYTAECNGPQTNASWSRNFEAGDAQYLYATTFMAAMDYYYGDIQGLLRPKKNCFICSKMKLSVYDEPCECFNGEFFDIRGTFGLLSQIKIYNNVNYHIPQIYTTVIHELTHSAHYEISPYHFIFADDIVLESWSCGVGWFMAFRKWPNYFHKYGRAKGNTVKSHDYTGIVQDLMDGIDVSNGDMVEGYTIAEIQAALIAKCKMNDWKENLKTKYNNATEENLDALFDYWN